MKQINIKTKIIKLFICLCLSLLSPTSPKTLVALAEGREQNSESCQSTTSLHDSHGRRTDPGGRSREPRPVKSWMSFWVETRRRRGGWPVLTCDVGTQREEEEGEAPVKRREEAPERGERRSETQAERTHDPWAGSVEEWPPPRPRAIWSWSAPVGGRSDWRGCVWTDAAEGLGCGEAARAGPRSRSQRRRKEWRKEKEEAGRSDGEEPEEPETWREERRAGSDRWTWEPAASPSPSTAETETNR